MLFQKYDKKKIVDFSNSPNEAITPSKHTADLNSSHGQENVIGIAKHCRSCSEKKFERKGELIQAN